MAREFEPGRSPIDRLSVSGTTRVARPNDPSFLRTGNVMLTIVPFKMADAHDNDRIGGAMLAKRHQPREEVVVDVARETTRFAELATLASVDIQTALVADLSGNLHSLFDPVSNGALPIYFGPLLGRLYLEGL